MILHILGREKIGIRRVNKALHLRVMNEFNAYLGGNLSNPDHFYIKQKVHYRIEKVCKVSAVTIIYL